MDAPHDLLIIGGGINGAAIARDAAGRGLSVVLCEQGDIGGATSSASTKLIHGGLRYLEHYAFRLVAESLAEREVLLRIAPHLTRPLRFVLPHSERLRPAWMISAGLLLYDSLARLHGRITLPAARRVDLAADPRGALLRPEFTTGFVYSDVATDDARLTLATARSAALAGAQILPRTRFLDACRADGGWKATLDQPGCGKRTVRARALVNAGGPWAGRLLAHVCPQAGTGRMRLVRGTHVVVRRLYEGDHAYTLQNDDGRVAFLIPFQRDFTLVGTTEVEVSEPELSAGIFDGEVDYLCAAVSRYTRRGLERHDIVWSYAGVRPLSDDGETRAASVSRDYRLVVDAGTDGRAPLISVFGGKLTTHRRLAETVLGRLAPWFPDLPGRWTATRPLPGGDLEGRRWPDFVAALVAERPALPAPWLADLAGRHGSDSRAVLDDAQAPADLGRDFGGGLFEREADYCIAHEWATCPDDILWRRTKCGLFMTPAERQAFSEWFSRRSP